MEYRWRGKPWEFNDLSHLVATMTVVIMIPPEFSYYTSRMYIGEKNVRTRNTT